MVRRYHYESDTILMYLIMVSTVSHPNSSTEHLEIHDNNNLTMSSTRYSRVDQRSSKGVIIHK